MASKYHGFFEVTNEFVNDNVGIAEVGAWLVIGLTRGTNYPAVYGEDFTRRDAVDFLRQCIRLDWNLANDYDYEIWHVVDNPDWMPGVVTDDEWGTSGERYACAPVRRVNGRTVSFDSVGDARYYVQTALGVWSVDFDVDAIVHDITRWYGGRLCLLAVDFWAVAAAHDLTHA